MGVITPFVTSRGPPCRWWFHVFFFIPTWRNDPIWRAYFSNGWFNHQLEWAFPKIWFFPRKIIQFQKRVFPYFHHPFSVFVNLYFWEQPPKSRAEDDVGYLLGQSLGWNLSLYTLSQPPLSRSWGFVQLRGPKFCPSFVGSWRLPKPCFTVGR